MRRFGDHAGDVRSVGEFFSFLLVSDLLLRISPTLLSLLLCFLLWSHIHGLEHLGSTSLNLFFGHVRALLFLRLLFLSLLLTFFPTPVIIAAVLVQNLIQVHAFAFKVPEYKFTAVAHHLLDRFPRPPLARLLHLLPLDKDVHLLLQGAIQRQLSFLVVDNLRNHATALMMDDH